MVIFCFPWYFLSWNHTLRRSFSLTLFLSYYFLEPSIIAQQSGFSTEAICVDYIFVTVSLQDITSWVFMVLFGLLGTSWPFIYLLRVLLVDWFCVHSSNRSEADRWEWGGGFCKPCLGMGPGHRLNGWRKLVLSLKLIWVLPVQIKLSDVFVEVFRKEEIVDEYGVGVFQARSFMFRFCPSLHAGGFFIILFRFWLKPNAGSWHFGWQAYQMLERQSAWNSYNTRQRQKGMRDCDYTTSSSGVPSSFLLDHNPNFFSSSFLHQALIFLPFIPFSFVLRLYIHACKTKYYLLSK